MSTENKTYEVSALEQKNAARAAHFAIITEKCAHIMSTCMNVQSEAIEIANLSRECGLEIRAALDKEQLKFEYFEGFFRAHAAELPEWFTSNSARKFLACYDKHPEPITDFKTALHVMEEVTFFSLGLMEEPTRALVQTAVGRAPLEVLVGIWSKQDELLARFKEQLSPDRWTPSIWQTIAAATKSAAELNSRAELELRRRQAPHNSE